MLSRISSSTTRIDHESLNPSRPTQPRPGHPPHRISHYSPTMNLVQASCGPLCATCIATDWWYLATTIVQTLYTPFGSPPMTSALRAPFLSPSLSTPLNERRRAVLGSSTVSTALSRCLSAIDGKMTLIVFMFKILVVRFVAFKHMAKVETLSITSTTPRS
ncbi:hypothetical protein VTI74DRAFT_5568 [Chaetomium olivicolor]